MDNEFPTPLKIVQIRAKRLEQEMIAYYYKNGPYNNYHAANYLDAEIDVVVARMNAAGWRVDRLADGHICVNPPDYTAREIIGAQD